jgi:hypothetical protein
VGLTIKTNDHSVFLVPQFYILLVYTMLGHS